MNFKICDRKTLCIDLRKSNNEEIMLVVSTLMSTCELLEQAGLKPFIKVTEESESSTSNKQVC